ncbi:hypothetical protein V6N13_048887 [Hibiscus sabdariffa]
MPLLIPSRDCYCYCSQNTLLIYVQGVKDTKDGMHNSEETFDDDDIEIQEEYESLPSICFHCGKYGHNQEGCPDLEPTEPNEEQADPYTETMVHQNLTDSYGPWMVAERHPRREPPDPINEAAGLHPQPPIDANCSGNIKDIVDDNSHTSGGDQAMAMIE